jgi:hypothetical protein
MKQQVFAVVGLSGVVGGGAHGQIGRGTWEARQGEGFPSTLHGENITLGRSCRESDRPIVVEKRGNSRGAKGPDRRRVVVDMKGDPLEQTFHYGRTGEGIPDPGIGKEGSYPGKTL